MGAIGLTTLVLAVTAAVGPPLPELPPVQIPTPPPVEIPKVPDLPVAPPQVTAVPTIVPTATPTAKPAATPAPPTTQTARPVVTTPQATATPRRGTRVIARPAPRPRATATPRRQTRVAARGEPDTGATPPKRSPPDRAGARRAPGEATTNGIAGDVLELVEALPPAILWSLVGIAAIALGLAGNAFWQSRQRAALEAQRLALIDDIGLLSRALLPPVPELDGLAVSAAYRPADGPAAGGDFYDVFRLDEHRVGVLLGDVSGHGRDSVTLAALARYTLRTLLAAGLGPGDALAGADRMLEHDLRPRFVTVIAAVYDRRTTRLTYAKAGHAPPIVIGTAHDPDAETPACPIGAGVGEHWPEYHVDLAEGVCVCLVTDGLEDAKREGARLGRAEVERLVAAQAHPDAQRLLSDVGELADHVSDDTAAVVLARR